MWAAVTGLTFFGGSSAASKEWEATIGTCSQNAAPITTRLQRLVALRDANDLTDAEFVLAKHLELRK